MEPNINQTSGEKKKALKTILISAAVLIIALGLAYYLKKQNEFCFNFAYDTQFGDRSLENPSNEGFPGPNGTEYYLPEVPALQIALQKEGFYVDELEATGGGIYLSSFFGPSTKAAVIAFQEKYDLAPTGEVNNNTIDKLREIYGCSATDTATSTTTYSISTTTIE